MENPDGIVGSQRCDRCDGPHVQPSESKPKRPHSHIHIKSDDVPSSLIIKRVSGANGRTSEYEPDTRKTKLRKRSRSLSDTIFRKNNNNKSTEKSYLGPSGKNEFGSVMVFSHDPKKHATCAAVESPKSIKTYCKSVPDISGKRFVFASTTYHDAETASPDAARFRCRRSRYTDVYINKNYASDMTTIATVVAQAKDAIRTNDRAQTRACNTERESIVEASDERLKRRREHTKWRFDASRSLDVLNQFCIEFDILL